MVSHDPRSTDFEQVREVSCSGKICDGQGRMMAVIML